MSYILSAEGLRFMDFISYPKIQIEDNCFTFIIGESGCGKSTLLKLLNATALSSAGTVYYRNQNIREIDPVQYRRKVLLAPQDVFLFDATIRENFNLYYASRDEKPIDNETLENVLNICCVDFPLNTKCSVLSGGERQRIFLAVCLSFLPDVLLLDEPTSALDEKTAKALLSNIKSYCSLHKITPVAVCHSGELVKQYAEHTIHLDKESKY